MDSKSLIITRGTHPHEVTAFYLAKEVSSALKQRDYNVSLMTIPYDYSLNYLVDHKPILVMRCLKTPKDQSEFVPLEREYIEALERSDMPGIRRDCWDHNLTAQFPEPIIYDLRMKNPGKILFDFHNFPAGTAFDRRDHGLVSIFTLNNKFDGFVDSEDVNEKYFTVEIPAFFRALPKEILERRKNVIDFIKQNERMPSDYLDYLESVADFKESARKGLTDNEATKIIAEAVEDVFKMSSVPIEAKNYIADLGGSTMKHIVRSIILEGDEISTAEVIGKYKLKFGLPKKGKVKSDKKIKIVTAIESLLKDGEVVSTGKGLHYVWPPKQNKKW